MRLANLGFIEPLIVDHALADRLHVRVRGPLGLGVHRRPGHLVLGIEVVPFGSRAMSGKCGQTSETKSTHGLPSCRACALLEPGLGGRGDALVIILVGGVAPARIGRELEGGLAHGQRITQQAQRIADPLDDVQRHVLLGEAVVDRGALQVQLADRVDAMAGRPQTVPPCRHAAVVGDGIVPEADSGGRSARCESWRARARKSASCSRRP